MSPRLLALLGWFCRVGSWLCLLSAAALALWALAPLLGV